jgi:cytochrome c553
VHHDREPIEGAQLIALAFDLLMHSTKPQGSRAKVAPNQLLFVAFLARFDKAGSIVSALGICVRCHGKKQEDL